MESSINNNHILKPYSLAKNSLGEKLTESKIAKEIQSKNLAWVHLDSLREIAQIVKDELSNLLSDRINKNMYILSVITAIFLPLGFLTGLLGVNVGGIPVSDNPHGFDIVSGSLMLVVIIQIFLSLQ